MVDLPEHSNDTAVINSGNENSEQICQKCGLFLEVESQGFVVTVMKKLTKVQFIEKFTCISTLAARTITSLNWLCSQASAERSIIARAALSWKGQ